MRIDKEKQEVTLTISEIVDYKEKGLVSGDFLKEIENEMGRKTALPTVKVGSAFKEDALDMYYTSIQNADAVVASNEVYEKIYYAANIEKDMGKWCTKELFEYLELEPERALKELKAAAYPMVVSYTESRRWKTGDALWRIPSITFLDRTDARGIKYPKNVEKNAAAVLFYLNNRQEVKFSIGNVTETYSQKDLKGKDWHEFAVERERSGLVKKRFGMPLVYAEFENIKTGDKMCALVEQMFIGSKVEQMRDRIDGTAWYKTWKGTEKRSTFLTEAEKRHIIEKGRESIENLHNCIFDASNLRTTPDGRYARFESDATNTEHDR